MKLADAAPAFCASCHAQKPDVRHVDFGAAFDGPVMELAGGGTTAVAIDDLVVCEDCVRAAAAVLPGDEGNVSELDQLRAELAETKRLLELRKDLAGKLQDALSVKNAVEREERRPRRG